ncbi:MAG: glycosyltransferase family 2 protein, partial [Candidatus Hodarchaeales archaeon]
MNKHFKIVIPLYNVEKWIKYCIRSVKAQTYRDFECIIIDDISTDNTVDIIKKEIKNDSRFKLKVNSEKCFALKNIYEGISLLNPDKEDIIVTLDGDDWLAGKDVLKKLKDTYDKKECWMTYGSYAEYPSNTRGKFSKQIPFHIIESSEYRNHEWCSSHLRTFKFHLWDRIDKKDLLDSENKFYRMAWDLAFMLPMLEMSGHKACYIQDILYIYNLINPLNDHKVDNSYQIKLEKEIRSKPKYDKIGPDKTAALYLNANRFDIAAKVLYADSIYNKTNSKFAKELYLEHLKVWNNFHEKNPAKSSPEEFITSFHKTLDSIDQNGFNKSEAVPVILNSAINGAHRIASCIVLDKTPETYEADISEGQYDCGYEYFKNKKDFVASGLKELYLDEMALEFCRRKDNLYTITLFPSHDVSYTSLVSNIRQGQNIIYSKKIKLNKLGQRKYVHNLYYNEAWIGRKKDGYPGVIEKTNYCFQNGDEIQVLLVEENDISNLLNLKDTIRSICGVGKHSVHINDTQEETWRIASSVFNKNSVSFLNNSKNTETPNFDTYFSQYKNIIKNRSDKHDFCIDASAVLSAYGLRDCRDLDFLHLKDIGDLTRDISCH